MPFDVWIQTPRGVTEYNDVHETIRLPDRTEVVHRYRSRTQGEIVRVRQEVTEGGGPEPGYDLLLYPQGTVSDVVDALRLPTGEIRAADVNGTEHNAEGRIMWLYNNDL